MPMVSLSGHSLEVMFMPPVQKPVLASLGAWSPGDTFQPAASWFAALDPAGGAGARFNNQYGFTFMGEIPTGKALGLRLTSLSSSDLRFWNYSRGLNLFDEVVSEVGGHVLWNGSMWHNYVTLPKDAPAGTYTATFEIFIANATFAAGTGFADYSAAALSATQDMSYGTALIDYSWTVVPEPETWLLAVLGGALLALRAWRLRRS